jgi:HK97 family phage major capsid protein
MWNQAEVLDTATGQPLPYPTDNDTTQTGALVGEGAQVNTADVSLSQIMFGAYKFTSNMVKVSIELLQDSAFDLESFLTKKFSTRLGRISNTYFTTGLGSGSNQPNGIVTASVSSGQTVIGDENASAPDPTSQVGYTDLVNLEHSIDPLYRKGAKYMMHDQTLRFIKTLKDKYGRPLWLPGMAVAAPDTILSYPFSINNDMAQLGPSGSPAVGSKSVLFGPLDKYMIRRVKEMSVLRLVERFADYGQVAFLAFARYDGNLLDAGTHPTKYLQNTP